MQKNRIRGNIWNNSIVIAIILIIIIGIIIGIIYLGDGIFNQPDNVLKPEQVLADKNKYIGENIIVEGFFYQVDTGDSFGYISSNELNDPIIQGENEEIGTTLLLVNRSSINNLIEEFKKYYFYGTVRENNFSEFQLDIIYLDVQKIEVV